MDSDPTEQPSARLAPAGAKPKPRTIVYACSGCSDAGELADRAARALSQQGTAQMSCLAGIGGRVTSLVKTANNAERILVIDGCPLNCARKTLALAGFTEVEHLELHRLGFRKGACPPTPEHIAVAVNAATEMLEAPTSITPGTEESQAPVASTQPSVLAPEPLSPAGA